MKAKIINKDYSVISYRVNGRTRRIVEPAKRKSTKYDRIVFNAIHETQSHDWETVLDHIESKYGITIKGGDFIDKAISRNTLLLD